MKKKEIYMVKHCPENIFPWVVVKSKYENGRYVVVGLYNTEDRAKLFATQKEKAQSVK